MEENLKQISSKLKEMSNRKEIEEYEAIAEKSQRNISSYLAQIEIAKSSNFDPDAKQHMIDYFDNLMAKESETLSYNNKIISAYNELMENKTKKNTLDEIERLKKENEILASTIADVLNEPTLYSGLNNEMDFYDSEVKKLSEEKSNLVKEQVMNIFNKSVLEQIEKELDTVQKYLIPAKDKLDKTKQKVSAYNSYIENNKLIKQLESQLTPEDNETKVNLEIEKSQRILPEKLQKNALELAEQNFKDNIEQAKLEQLNEMNISNVTMENLTQEQNLEQQTKEQSQEQDSNSQTEEQSKEQNLEQAKLEQLNEMNVSNVTMENLTQEPLEEDDYFDENVTPEEQKKADEELNAKNASKNGRIAIGKNSENNNPITVSTTQEDTMDKNDQNTQAENRDLGNQADDKMLNEIKKMEEAIKKVTEKSDRPIAKMIDMDKILERASKNSYTDLSPISPSNLEENSQEYGSVDAILKGMNSNKDENEEEASKNYYTTTSPNSPSNSEENSQEYGSAETISKGMNSYQDENEEEVQTMGTTPLNSPPELIEISLGDEPEQNKNQWQPKREKKSEVIRTRKSKRRIKYILRKKLKKVATTLLLMGLGITSALYSCGKKETKNSSSETSVSSQATDIVIEDADNQDYTYNYNTEPETLGLESEDLRSETETEDAGIVIEDQRSETEIEDAGIVIEDQRSETEPEDPGIVIEDERSELETEDPGIVIEDQRSESETEDPGIVIEDLREEPITIEEVNTPQEIPQSIEGITIETPETTSQWTDEYLQDTQNVTDPLTIKNALWHSGIMEKKAEDEYSAAAQNWTGIKPEDLQWWTDSPLRFTKDEATGVYRIDQQDENGNWVGMGFTDEESYYNYLEESNKYTNTKGARR